MPKILRMKDKSDNFTVKKDKIFDLSMRLIVCGPTGCGKTNALASLLLLPEFFGNDFLGTNIYIFSPLINDFKMLEIIKLKKIPDINIFTEFDDNTLNLLYEKLTEEFKDKVEGKVKDPKKLHTLVLLDDLSFDGSLKNKNFGAVARLFMNGRKHQISTILTTQYWNHILPACRQNITGAIVYTNTEKSLDAMTDDLNMIGKPRLFKDLFRTVCKEKHDYMVINFSNNRKEGIYMNSDFEKIA